MSDKETTVFSLCGTKKEPQCPVVEITETEIIITDDSGSRVRMTKNQFNILLERMTQEKQAR